MNFSFLDSRLTSTTGIWNHIFDTRLNRHVRQPYFYKMEWARLKLILKALYCKDNVFKDPAKFFHSDMISTGLVDKLYSDSEFINEYAYALPFIKVEWYENTFIIYYPKQSGSWFFEPVYFRFSTNEELTDECVNKLKEEIQRVIPPAFSNFGCSNIHEWNEFYVLNVPGFELLRFYSDYPVIYDSSRSILITGREFSQYPLTWSLEFDIFGEKKCFDENAGVNRSILYQTYQYSYPVTKIFGPSVKKHPRFKNKKLYHDKGPSYGVELELKCDHDEQYLIDTQDVPFFILKSDISITGAGLRSYELVTRPMDYRSHRVAWGKWFATIWDDDNKTYTGFDCSKQTENGLHIHVGQESFRRKGHDQKFLWFFVDPLNHEFLTFVSERGKKMSRYCRFPNNFTQSRKSDFKNVRELLYDYDSRGSVYITDKGTYEVRIFKGIVSYATVMKNLEFVDSVFHFTEFCSYSKLNIKGYLEWLRETPKNKYKLIKEFLSEMSLDELIKNSNITHLFYGCYTPQSALSILKSKEIKPDQNILVFLNKRLSRKGEKTFIIKNGEYILNPKHFGTLKHRDKEANPFKADKIYSPPDNIAGNPQPLPPISTEIMNDWYTI